MAASIADQDRYFSGQIDASAPDHLLAEGTLTRLLNGRFVEGAITNAISFEEFFPEYAGGTDVRIFASPTTYQQLLTHGDVQLVAPLQNTNGKFLILVVSGVLLQIELESLLVTDITPPDAFLPPNSNTYALSFLDNDGGTYGSGGYLVIFNYPNKCIFVTPSGARLANPLKWETPPSRMGATAGKRAFTISGYNLMYASDPLGGASSTAPLTFQETLSPAGTYFGQVFTIGSGLDVEYVTNISRLPRYLGAAQEFLSQQLLVSTNRKKYVVAAASDRATWDLTQFISYAGSAEGISGPLASTNIGDVLMYTSTTGRQKSIGQDQQFNTGLTETFLDDYLGQYLCCEAASFYFRDWYYTLDHSRSNMVFSKGRLYTSVYPMQVDAVGKFGEDLYSPSFRAMAVASLDSSTRIGPEASLAWEGFYDYIQPIGIVTIQDDVYVVSKNDYGRISFLKENLHGVSPHTTTVYTRGYFSKGTGKSKSILEGQMYFRKLEGPVKIKISYLIDEVWRCGPECVVASKIHRFSFRADKCSTNSAAIPLKIDIDHGGCRFELEAIRVEGEDHRQEKQ